MIDGAGVHRRFAISAITTTDAATGGVAALQSILVHFDDFVVEFRLLFAVRVHVALTIVCASLTTKNEDDDDENDDGDADAETDDGDQLGSRQRVVVPVREGSRRFGDAGGDGVDNSCVGPVGDVAVGAAVTGVASAFVITVFVKAIAVNAWLTNGALVQVAFAFFPGVTFGAFAFEPAGNFHARSAVGAGHQRAGFEGFFALFAHVSGVASAGECASFQIEAGAAVGARIRIASASPGFASPARVAGWTLTCDFAEFAGGAFAAILAWIIETGVVRTGWARVSGGT